MGCRVSLTLFLLLLVVLVWNCESFPTGNKVTITTRRPNIPLSPSPFLPQTRQRQALLDTSTTTLYGNLHDSSLLYIQIFVGGSPFTVQIDTGSASTDIVGRDCFQYETQSSTETHAPCPDASVSPYDWKKRESHILSCSKDDCNQCNGDQCFFKSTYGDGTFLEGPLISDNVTIAGLSMEAIVGVTIKQSKDFSRVGIDGIFGMSFAALETKDGDCLFCKLFEAKLIENDVFSICFGDSSGHLNLGGWDESFHKSPIMWVPLKTPYDYFRIKMISMSVGGFLTSASGADLDDAIVDSGTTLFLLKSKAYDAFKETFQEKFATLPFVNGSVGTIFDDNRCFYLSVMEMSILPNISVSVTLEDGTQADLTIQPRHYLLYSTHADFDQNCYYLAIQREAPKKGRSYNILGDVFMQAFDTIFDKSKKRIGFAQVDDCSGSEFVAEIVEGNGQIVMKGDVASPLRVKVTDQKTGEGVEGIIVSFYVVKGRVYEAFLSDDNKDIDQDIRLIQTTVFNRMTNASGVASLDSLIPIESGLLTLSISAPGVSHDQAVFQISVHPSDLSMHSSLVFSTIESLNFDLEPPKDATKWVTVAILCAVSFGAMFFVTLVAVRVLRRVHRRRVETQTQRGLLANFESDVIADDLDLSLEENEML